MKRLKKGILASFVLFNMIILSITVLVGYRIRNRGANRDEINKWREFYRILVQWVRLYQDKRSIAPYFEHNGYSVVAIYGMRELGQLLYRDLKEADIEVKYVIDRNKENVRAEVPILSPEDTLPKVDAMIVTAVHDYDEIELMLRGRTDSKIISLAAILLEY